MKLPTTLKPLTLKPARALRQQRGVLIIEALLGLLVFSLGILALIAMQARAIAQVDDAKQRGEASLLVTQIIGQMWLDDPTSLDNYACADLAACSSGTKTSDWVAGLSKTLPNVTTVIVEVTKPANNNNLRQVTVQMNWRSPQAPSTAPAHSFSSRSLIPATDQI